MVRPLYARSGYWLVLLLVLAPLLMFADVSPVGAVPVLPPGFVDEPVVSVGSPTALAFTPDGRMLVTRQPGQLMVYRDGALQGTAINFVSNDRICTNAERGLLGVAVDPAFATNRTIFLFYTFKKVDDSCVNRVSSFVLPESNTIAPASETVLLDNMPSPGGNHNGGDLNFGKDGFLYVSIGEGGIPAVAPQLNILSGKILRITRDGGIPAGNPYQGMGTARCNTTGQTTAGVNCQEIFASGLRNPFRFAFDPNAAETRFLINDVGQSTWEEIDEGQAGANYGWPSREGFCATDSATDCGSPPAGLTNPTYAYDSRGDCGSITGGAFVPAGAWSADYAGAYLFGDFICDELFMLRPASGGGWTATTLVSNLGSGVIQLRFGPYLDTQALYYATYGGGGEVRRIVQRFADVAADHPAYQAVEELRARGLVQGYEATACVAKGLVAPCFGPADTNTRAEMAVMIVRAMGWSGEQATNPFTDRGGLDAELWNAVAILAAREVALGYGDGRYGPNEPVTQSQVASFITRAMVERGYWQLVTTDDATIYPNVPASTEQRLDLVTYVQNAGALPDYPASANWASWSDPATRGWFARALWQALETVAP